MENTLDWLSHKKILNNFSFFLMIVGGVLVLGIITIPTSSAAEDTEIIVSIKGDGIIDLDTQNRLIRATIKIINFDPAEEYYYMQVIQPNGKIINEQEIFPKDKDNNIWGTDIGFLLVDDVVTINGKAIQGDYTIRIFTEVGSSTGSTTFSVIKSSEPQSLPDIPEANSTQSQTSQDDDNLVVGFSSKTGEKIVELRSDTNVEFDVATTVDPSMSPRKQIAQGISSNEVICKEGLELIFKYDGSPACVTDLTADKLVDRGWAKT